MARSISALPSSISSSAGFFTVFWGDLLLACISDNHFDVREFYVKSLEMQQVQPQQTIIAMKKPAVSGPWKGQFSEITSLRPS
jgi:hypothetical protein